ncbi:MAG: hypothetical protein NVSMB59_14560 [Vulcanimicrobiaceae bacterium]
MSSVARDVGRTHRGAAFAIAYADLAARVAGRTGPSGRNLCHWCECEVGPRRRIWCGDACADAYWNAATWRGLRTAVGKRDRGICRICLLDCRALRRAYAALSPRDRVPFALRYEIPKRRLRSTWWDADHIVPIAEGGRNELANLRTLCLRCHKAETRALARRRAATRQSATVWLALEHASALLDAATLGSSG